MPGKTVDVADREVTVGLIADYGRMLYESAHLLAAVAQAPRAVRDDEFDVLLAIECESSETYSELVQQLHRPDESLAPVAAEHERNLVSAVHALFEVYVRIGAALVACDARDLPDSVIDNARLVQDASKALARALESQRDQAEIESCLWALQLGVQELDHGMPLISQSDGAPSASSR